MTVRTFIALTCSVIILMSCTVDNLEESSLIDTIDPIAIDPIPIIEEEEEEKEEVTISDPNTEKAINWVTLQQLPNGLLESSENSNFVSTYDNALATLVFIEQGELEKAERILDFFNGKIDAELKSGAGGYYQFRNRDGENGRRNWMGDNAWLLVAINTYHQVSGNQKYNEMAHELELWIRSLQDTDGGLWGGQNTNGTQIPKVTEGILVAFNAVPGYDDFHENILSYLKENRWSANEKTIVSWPENPAYNYALDLHSMSYLALKDFPDNILDQADRYLNTQIATASGEKVTGYCFDEDKDVIWLEGTAQIATAYQLATNTAKADDLLNDIEKTFISSTLFENAEGIPYATNPGTSYETSKLWESADIASALSSTTWYIFAKQGFNPLAIGKRKNIPSADVFWVEAL